MDTYFSLHPFRLRMLCSIRLSRWRWLRACVAPAAAAAVLPVLDPRGPGVKPRTKAKEEPAVP